MHILEQSLLVSSNATFRWHPGVTQDNCLRRDGQHRVVNRLVSQVSSGLLQTAQTWANAGVCGGLCACAVGGTFD